jgi:hypothetical protein
MRFVEMIFSVPLRHFDDDDAEKDAYAEPGPRFSIQIVRNPSRTIAGRNFGGFFL